MRSSVAARIVAVIIYLIVAFTLFDLGINNVISQEVYIISIVLTAAILAVAVTMINRDAKEDSRHSLQNWKNIKHRQNICNWNRVA